MAFYALIAAFVHAEDDSLSEVGALVLPWCTNSTELGTQLGMAKGKGRFEGRVVRESFPVIYNYKYNTIGLHFINKRSR